MEHVHENLEEIREMEDKHMKSRLFKIANMTILRNFLSHEDFIIGIYYYWNESQFSRETAYKLAGYP